jgi:DNA-binding response OmpR family regulator
MFEEADPTHKTILIYERDRQLRRVISASLESQGCRVLQASDIEFAERLLQREIPDLLLIEFCEVGNQEGKLITQFRAGNAPNSPSPVLVTTIARPEKEWIREHKPDLLVYKPYDVRHLQNSIREVLEERVFDG